LSNSIITEAARYAGTRILGLRIAALCLLLLAALVVSTIAVPSPDILIRQAGFLVLAIVTFRLWDDLADLTYDRLHHPQRVLVTAESLLPFVVAVLAGLSSLAWLLRDDSHRLAVLLLLSLLLAVLYHSPPGRSAARPFRAGLLLAKYPVFLILAGSLSFRLWASGLVVYAILAAFEWHDDRSLRGAAKFLFIGGVTAGVVIATAFHYSSGVLS